MLPFLLAHLGAAEGIQPNEVAGMLTLYVSPLLGYMIFRGRAAILAAPPRMISKLSAVALGVFGLFDTIQLTWRVAWLTGFGVGMAAAAARVWNPLITHGPSLG